MYTPLFRDLGFDVKPSSEWQTVDCPFCSGKKASLNTFKGLFKCHRASCNHELLTLGSLYSEIKGESLADSQTAIDNFREETGVSFEEIDKPPKKVQVFFRQFMELTEPITSACELARSYCESRDIAITTLINEGIRVTRNGKYLAIPQISSTGKIIGIAYRDFFGNQSYEPGSTPVLWGIDKLDRTKPFVILVEGASDRLKLVEAGVPNVVSVPGVKSFKATWVREFSGIKKVILIPDSDDGGADLQKRVKEYLGARVEVHHLPWSFGQVGKDICEWARYNDIYSLVAALSSEFEARIAKMLTFSDLLDISTQPDTENWLLPGLIERQSFVIIAGPAKSRKTFFALQLCRAFVDTSFKFLDFEPNTVPRKVLFIEEEGSLADYSKRVATVFNGVDPKVVNQLFFSHYSIGLKLMDMSGVELLCEKISACSPDVLVIDNLQEIFSGDEIGPDMAKFLANIKYIKRMYPMLTIILLHHFNKMAETRELSLTDLRGHTQLAGTIDLAILMRKKDDKEGKKAEIRFDGRTFIGEPGSRILSFDDKSLHFHPFNVVPIAVTAKDRILQFLGTVKENRIKLEDMLLTEKMTRKTFDNCKRRILEWEVKKEEGVEWLVRRG